MTSDEYSKLRNADSESFEKIVCVVYSGLYAAFLILLMIRGLVSHTYLFMEGYYTKEEKLDYIKSDGFFEKTV